MVGPSVVGDIISISAAVCFIDDMLQVIAEVPTEEGSRTKLAAVDTRLPKEIKRRR